MRKIISLILIGAALALVGCQLPLSGGSTTTTVGDGSTTIITPKKACIILTSTESACAFYSGDNYSESEVLSLCVTGAGGAVSTACPTSNVYGTCTVTMDVTEDSYYMVIYNDSSAQAKADAVTDCQAITGGTGVWTLNTN